MTEQKKSWYRLQDARLLMQGDYTTLDAENACAIKAGWRQVIADEGERRRSRIRDGKCDVRGNKPERVRNNAAK